MQRQELILKIYKYLDEGYLVSEIADTLDLPEERIWQVIEDVEKEDEREYEIPRRHNIYQRSELWKALRIFTMRLRTAISLMVIAISAVYITNMAFKTAKRR